MLVDCVEAVSRTPAVAALHAARRLGIPVHSALRDVKPGMLHALPCRPRPFPSTRWPTRITEHSTSCTTLSRNSRKANGYGSARRNGPQVASAIHPPTKTSTAYRAGIEPTHRVSAAAMAALRPVCSSAIMTGCCGSSALPMEPLTRPPRAACRGNPRPAAHPQLTRRRHRPSWSGPVGPAAGARVNGLSGRSWPMLAALPRASAPSVGGAEASAARDRTDDQCDRPDRAQTGSPRLDQRVPEISLMTAENTSFEPVRQFWHGTRHAVHRFVTLRLVSARPESGRLFAC